MSVSPSFSEEPVCERCGFDPCDCSDPGRVEPPYHEGVDRFLPDSDFQCHQPEQPIEVNEPFVPTEAEKDVADKPIRIAHMKVGGKAPKRSRSPPPPRRVARLDTFFDQYDTPLAQRVTMCRAYASFVASTLPKKQKK